MQRSAGREEAGEAVQIRVRGCVQGVGFRPTVWRFARDLHLNGEVLNDAEGVLIRVRGDGESIKALIAKLRRNPPPLARIDAIQMETYRGSLPGGLRIVESGPPGAHTQIASDAAICACCAAEILDTATRRTGYAFTNCTHCGPRLTIVTGVPYDRANTTMAQFDMCADCLAEYHEPSDRRFHAEPIACPVCGPRLELVALGGGFHFSGGHDDSIATAGQLIRGGAILAIKGLGGFQFACDAANSGAVARLRQRKRRYGKPLALMARDLEMVRRYCKVTADEAAVLNSAAAPIMILPRRAALLPEAIAPGVNTLGFMLPTTPLHLLLCLEADAPLVMTSGNFSDEPQATGNEDALTRLAAIADVALLHNREIANRMDDSVVRVMAGKPRLLRRARGYVPRPIRLPAGFDQAPEILAYGGELKSAFCLVKDGEAILSQHQGDLEHPAVLDDYCKNLALFRNLFEHRPLALAADLHPEYLSSKLARARNAAEGLPLIEIQHHHAHTASCLAENGYALDAPPVLGIALDGLGWGDDGTIWGGEFLLADYRDFTRAGHFKPVAMPGGVQAIQQPWRNLYAHLRAAGRTRLALNRTGSAPFAKLAAKPLAALDALIASGFQSPTASSCGRLFDAVAAALDICFDEQLYEGEAATRLESLAASADGDAGAYRMEVRCCDDSPPQLDPAPLWATIAEDLAAGTAPSAIAARFHAGLADGIMAMVEVLARHHDFESIALSGGCFQNRLLFESVLSGLANRGFRCFTHWQVPANDGGLALGQAAIAAAHLIDQKSA